MSSTRSMLNVRSPNSARSSTTWRFPRDEDGKLPIEMTISEQAGMAAGWNVRVNQFADQDPIDMVWDGGRSPETPGSSRRISNTDVAMDFINFATRAIPVANFSRLVPDGPINLTSLPLIREDRHPLLPTSPANLDVQFIQNWNWWSAQPRRGAVQIQPVDY